MVIKNKILDRKIDIAKRLILDAYIGAEQKKVIDVIFAQTGVGKTFTIAWSLLKNDIDKGYKKFLFVTPFVDSREQDIEEFDNANYKLKLNIKVTKDINEFLNWDSNTPILLVATLAGATLGNIIDTNGEKIKKYLSGEKFAVYWDESHYSASSSKETTIFNNGSFQSKYKATYFRFVWDLVQLGGRVTGFTATPVTEQLEELDTNYYRLLTDLKKLPDVQELAYISSQIFGIDTYDINVETYIDGLESGITMFNNWSSRQKLLADKISKYESDIEFETKGICQIVAATSNATDESGINYFETLNELSDILISKGLNDKIIAGATSKGGYILYDANGDRIRKVGTFKEFKNILKKSGNNVEYLLTIDKFKYGLNIANIVSQIHLRLRKQSQVDNDNKVTTSIIQTFGRAVRTWYGIKGLNFYNVADAVKWLIKYYGGSKVFEELRTYMKNANSHYLTVPQCDTFSTYMKGVEVWKTRYAASMEYSLFDMIDDVIICDKCNGTGKLYLSATKKRDIEIDEKKLNNVFKIA